MEAQEACPEGAGDSSVKRSPSPVDEAELDVARRPTGRRKTFKHATATMAGFENLADMDAATSGKYDKAAWIQIAAELAGHPVSPPRVALEGADLPCGKAERTKLARRVDKLKQAMGTAARTARNPPTLSAPPSRDAPEPAPEPAPAPAPAPEPSALEAAWRTKDARVTYLEAQQKMRTRTASSVTKKLADTERLLQQARKDLRDKVNYNQYVTDELLQVREELAAYIENNKSEEVEELCQEIQVFENGRYSDTIRLVYYTLLSNGVAPGNCRVVVGTTLKLLGINAASLPGENTARLMNLERSALSDMQAAEMLMKVDDGRAQLAGDEATKLGKSRFGLGFFCEEDGPGSPILFAALGVIDTLGGKAEATTEAITTLLSRIAANHTILQRLKGNTEETKLENLLKKFSATMSDSCAAQVNCNAMMLRLIATGRLPPGASEQDIVTMEGTMRSFYCWLHKAINLCKAVLKGMSFEEQQATLHAVPLDDYFQAGGVEEGGVEDSSLEGEGELARPAHAGQGHMAVWACFKLLCTKFGMDTLRRGEVYTALLENASIPGFTWMMIKGNREAAWLYDAGICLRYVIDPQCGAMNCSTCRHKYPDFVTMRAEEHDFIGNQLHRVGPPQPGVEMHYGFYPAVDTAPTAAGGNGLCVICYVEAKEKINFLEFSVCRRYFPVMRINAEWFGMRFLHEQLIEPVVRIARFRSAVDCVELAHRVRAAYIALKNDPRPFLSGARRLLTDWIGTQWVFQSDDAAELRRAREHFFLHDYRQIMDKILTAVWEHPYGNIRDIALMVIDHGGVLLCAHLRIDRSFCGLEKAVDYLQECVIWMVTHRFPNMLAYWTQAMNCTRDFAEVSDCLIVTVTVHECVRRDHTVGLSSAFLDLCCDILKHCGDELGIMHERQSGGLMDWIPAIYERRAFSFCTSSNDELESLLGGVDDRVRRFRLERTIVTGAHAVGNRNKTDEWVREKESKERSLCIQAARLAADGQAVFEKERQEKVKAHRVAKAAADAQEKADRLSRILQAAKKHEQTTVMSSREEFDSLSLPKLRLQVQYWQHQARHVWQGLVTERWRVLLGRTAKAFRLGDSPPARAEQAYALERQRYISLLCAVVSHHTVAMTSQMQDDLLKLCAPPDVTWK